jgi:hypothetical protein
MFGVKHFHIYYILSVKLYVANVYLDMYEESKSCSTTCGRKQVDILLQKPVISWNRSHVNTAVQ